MSSMGSVSCRALARNETNDDAEGVHQLNFKIPAKKNYSYQSECSD